MQSHIVAVQQDSVVLSLTRASTALAEARTIQQTKRILDVAAAAEIFARRQQLGDEIEGQAAAIKVEALRKLGEMLKATPRAEGAKTVGGGGSSGGHTVLPPGKSAPTLADLGLTKRESAIAQKLAELPEQAFDEVRAGHVSVAKAIAVAAAKRPAPAKKKPPPVVEPVYVEPEISPEVQDAINALAEENRQLSDRLAVESMDESEEGKLLAAQTIAELREEVRRLSVQCDSLTKARNALMVELAEAKKSAKYWAAQAKQLGWKPSK